MFCDVQIDRSTPVPICSEPCFAAFKFVNKVDPSQCSTCKKYFENSNKKSFVVFYEQDAHSFCSKTCLNVFIITNRKIVPCNWCKVKKYNFDMIKKELKIGQVIMMCSLNCLTLYQVQIIFNYISTFMKSIFHFLFVLIFLSGFYKRCFSKENKV